MYCPVASQRLVDPEENILRQIFCLGAITRKAVTDIEDAPIVLTYKFLPGRAISLEALLDQLDVLLQRFISLES